MNPRFWAFFVLLFLLGGCATSPPLPPGKPPNVRLGPVMPLLKASAPSTSGVKVVPDSSGRAHILVSAPELKQVIDITVGPDGVVDRQIIRSNAAPSTIDGAFDARGRLHVLLDDEHVYLEDGVWHNAAPTPWSKAGIKVSKPAFVRGAPNLIWKFEASGKDIGAASGHWEPVFVGGGMGALIIPWYFQTPKVILVAETTAGYGPWNVLSPESTKEAFLFDLAADKKGNVHVLYGMTDQVKYGVASAQSLEFTGVNSSAPVRNQTTTIHYIGVPEVRSWPRDHVGVLDPHVAIDSDSGSVFLGPARLVSGDKWMEVGYMGPVPRPGVLAGAGGSSFHAIVWEKSLGKSLYAMYSDFVWSAPIDFGALPTGLWKVHWTSMASTSEGKAMVVWQTDEGTVGRWIERIH